MKNKKLSGWIAIGLGTAALLIFLYVGLNDERGILKSVGGLMVGTILPITLGINILIKKEKR